MEIDGILSHASQMILDPRMLAVLVPVAIVVAGAGGVLAWWLRWRILPSVLSGAGLALALAVTLGAREPGSRGSAGQLSCLNDGFVSLGIVGSGSGQFLDTYLVLNLLLLVPFAFFGTVATRRPIAVLAASVAVTAGIEGFQSISGLGVCETQDFANNAFGALLAVVAGALVNGILAGLRRATGPRQAPAHAHAAHPTRELQHLS
ncbi:MAG: hypothetical protein QOJ50_704 [Cryptosporangiaceae bacterium]|nr:hypothetical protein [Cryptosporangiaceae bacterium]